MEYGPVKSRQGEGSETANRNRGDPPWEWGGGQGQVSLRKGGIWRRVGVRNR